MSQINKNRLSFGLLFLLGLIAGGYLTIDWLLTFVFDLKNKYYPMTDRPIFFFSLVFMIIGTQLFLAGFVAELITRNSSIRNNYKISKILN